MVGVGDNSDNIWGEDPGHAPTPSAEMPQGLGLPVYDDERDGKKVMDPRRLVHDAQMKKCPWVLVYFPSGVLFEFVESRPCLPLRILLRLLRGWRWVPNPEHRSHLPRHPEN